MIGSVPQSVWSNRYYSRKRCHSQYDCTGMMNGSVPVSMITPIRHATKEQLQLALRCKPFCSRSPDGFPCSRHRLNKLRSNRKMRLANFLLTKSQLVVQLRSCTQPLAASPTSHLYRLTAGRLLQPASPGRKSVLRTQIRTKLHVFKLSTRFDLPLSLSGNIW